MRSSRTWAGEYAGVCLQRDGFEGSSAELVNLRGGYGSGRTKPVSRFSKLIKLSSPGLDAILSSLIGQPHANGEAAAVRAAARRLTAM
jgi:hypothetical protein